MRIIAYLRVSTEAQASEGVSLDAQREQIRAWADLHGHTIVQWFSEALSAKDTKRPKLQEALTWAMADANDGLVVTKIDRLSRSVIDFATLMGDFQSADRALICIGDNIDMSTPSGRFVATVMASVAQLERELIGQRTKDALAEKKRQGIQLGRPPSEVVAPEVAERIRAERSCGASHRHLAEVFGVKVSTIRRLVTSS